MGAQQYVHGQNNVIGTSCIYIVYC